MSQCLSVSLSLPLSPSLFLSLSLIPEVDGEDETDGSDPLASLADDVSELVDDRTVQPESPVTSTPRGSVASSEF